MGIGRLWKGSKLARLAGGWLLALVALGPAGAQEITVKMATLAPDGSSWHQILREMGEKWKTLSGGRVQLRLYPGGVAGDDGDVVRKMRLGTLNGGSLGSSGLADIERWVLALQVPMMYASYEEFDEVLGQMGPKLEKLFLDKGYVVLHWTDAGWVHFFSKSPVRTPDDLRPLKLFTWGNEPEVIELYRAAGFHPVPLPSTEISTALQTGLVNALPTTPQGALLLQWYNYAKNMADLRWAVLLGGMVVTRTTWEKIPPELRPALLAAAQETGRRLRQEIRQSGARDIEAMRKRGLTVVHVDAQTEVLWRKAAEAAYPKIRGFYAPAEAFDEAVRIRDEYRRRIGTAGRR